MGIEPKRPYEDWSTERLEELEESLYDAEVNGSNVWFERDQVLNELNRRKMG